MAKSNAPALERLLMPALFASGIYTAARAINRRNVVIVMYHGFTSRSTHPGIENHEEKHVNVRALRQHLAFLKHHYTVVPLEQVVLSYTTGAPLPERPAVITVDDGYRSTYTVAYPVLEELQLPASVFLATDFVDNRRLLWTDRVEYAVSRCAASRIDVRLGDNDWSLDLRTPDARKAADRRLRSWLKAQPQAKRDQGVEAIEQAAGCSAYDTDGGSELYEPLSWSEASTMLQSGLVSFGAHTHTHVIVSRTEPDRASEELRLSKGIIEDRLGGQCRLFCYPNGRRGDFDARTRELVRQCGYSSALTTVYGMNGPDTDVYELRRYNLGKPMMRGELEVRLSGIMELGRTIRRRAS